MAAIWVSVMVLEHSYTLALYVTRQHSGHCTMLVIDALQYSLPEQAAGCTSACCIIRRVTQSLTQTQH